jgi:hypothetical protein
LFEVVSKRERRVKRPLNSHALVLFLETRNDKVNGSGDGLGSDNDVKIMFVGVEIVED